MWNKLIWNKLTRVITYGILCIVMFCMLISITMVALLFVGVDEREVKCIENTKINGPNYSYCLAPLGETDNKETINGSKTKKELMNVRN